MDESVSQLVVGAFVSVGGDVGVVIALPEYELPDGYPVAEDHCLVWYGQVDGNDGSPRCRTVPIEYCEPVTALSVYH